MRFSPVWILLVATPFVSSLRLRAERVLTEERNGVGMLVELLDRLPNDVAIFKSRMSRSRAKHQHPNAETLFSGLWSDFRKHIGRPSLPSPDLITPKATQDATMRAFHHYIDQDPNRIDRWHAYEKQLQRGKSAELVVPAARPNRWQPNRKTISDDMAKWILPTLWEEFKRARAPLHESYNVPSFYHLSRELQEEIKHSFWAFIYADHKRARKFEGLLTWLKRKEYGKRLLAQEMEAQKAELIKQQQWKGLRQEKELSGHEDVPTFDRLEPTLSEFLEPSQKAFNFVREDPRRKELSEQVAGISNPGSPDTELTLGRAS